MLYQLLLLENETGWVKIIDVSGKIVDEWNVESQNTIGSINVSHYSEGMYMFELELMNGKSIVKKLIVE